MATLSQVGFFYPNTIGFPMRVILVDANNVALIPGTILLADIAHFNLVITRPDGTTFSRTLDPAATYFVNGAVQYMFQAGDLPVRGRYEYVLTLVFNDARELPVDGKFTVLH